MMMSEALRHREKKLGMKSGEGEIINQQKKGDIYRNIVTSLLRSPGIEPVENCFTGNDGFNHHCLLTVSAPRFSVSRQYKSIQKQPPISRFSFPFLHHPTPTFPFLVSRCWLLGAFGGFAISGFSFPCVDKMDHGHHVSVWPTPVWCVLTLLLLLFPLLPSSSSSFLCP